jgi:hypothetical protein
MPPTRALSSERNRGRAPDSEPDGQARAESHPDVADRRRTYWARLAQFRVQYRWLARTGSASVKSELNKRKLRELT